MSPWPRAPVPCSTGFSKSAAKPRRSTPRLQAHATHASPRRRRRHRHIAYPRHPVSTPQQQRSAMAAHRVPPPAGTRVKHARRTAGLDAGARGRRRRCSAVARPRHRRWQRMRPPRQSAAAAARSIAVKDTATDTDTGIATVAAVSIQQVIRVAGGRCATTRTRSPTSNRTHMRISR